ncbi:MAG TPA: hypothetical protein DDZ80_00450 [Cyanobacteria bacterium UBA8803]|nr:hypothetical protein [Cyanobacteria bacterium UBA9273]HBL57085.1 hypothetical protein [Cyanobacteria bacterium UBA8803]
MNRQTKQLQAQIAQLQAIADNATDFIVRFDRQLRHLFVNRALTVAAGIPLDYYLGKTNEELGMPLELCHYWNCHLQDVFETAQPKTIEFEFETVNGRHWFQSKIVPEINLAGDVETLLAITRDIAEQKQAATELAQLAIRERAACLEAQAARQSMVNILERMNDGFVALDSEWRYTYVNKKAGQLLNREPEELIGKNIWAEFPEGVGQKFYHAYHQAMKEQAFIQLEEYYLPWECWFENRIYPTEEGLAIFFQDITERKRTEAALQASQERYDLAVRGSGDGLWDWHILTNETYLSPSWKQILGYEDGELETDSQVFLSRLHPDDYEWVQKAIADHLQQRTPFNIEFRLRNSTGGYTWVNSRGQAIWDEAGNPTRMAGSITDISDRKATEAALQQSEQQFRLLAETIDEVFFIYPIDYSQLLYVSPAYEQIWGRSCSTLYEDPNSWLETVHLDDRELVHEALQQQHQGEGFNQEYRIIRSDGAIRWIFARTFILFNSEGQADRLVGVAKDITEGKQAELALQQLNQELEYRVQERTGELERSQRFIQHMADASPNILYIYDLIENRNIYTNRNIATILGYTPAEIQAMGAMLLPMLMHPDDLPKHLDGLHRIHTVADGDILELEYRLRHANGEWRWIYSRYTIFTRTPDGAVQQIIGTAQDISDRKRTEEQLKTSLAEKEVLLREIHHRVKNNLNVIHSLLNMQARTIPDEALKNVLFDSQRRLQTMALIHEQLYQSKSLAKIDFAEYLHRLVRNLFAAANLNHQAIQVEIKAEPLALNLEAAIPIALIINELLTNSFKHAFPAGHSGIISVKFDRDDDKTLHLSISDNGVGLPPNLDLHKTSSLGMRLVHILVQQLRATLTVTNNNGTSFHLTFSQTH